MKTPKIMDSNYCKAAVHHLDMKSEIGRYMRWSQYPVKPRIVMCGIPIMLSLKGNARSLLANGQQRIGERCQNTFSIQETCFKPNIDFVIYDATWQDRGNGEGGGHFYWKRNTSHFLSQLICNQVTALLLQSVLLIYYIVSFIKLALIRGQIIGLWNNFSASICSHSLFLIFKKVLKQRQGEQIIRHDNSVCCFYFIFFLGIFLSMISCLYFFSF